MSYKRKIKQKKDSLTSSESDSGVPTSRSRSGSQSPERKSSGVTTPVKAKTLSMQSLKSSLRSLSSRSLKRRSSSVDNVLCKADKRTVGKLLLSGVVVCKSVKIHGGSYLIVEEDDRVDIYEAEGIPGNFVWATKDGESGTVPIQAIHIPECAWNSLRWSLLEFLEGQDSTWLNLQKLVAASKMTQEQRAKLFAMLWMEPDKMERAFEQLCFFEFELRAKHETELFRAGVPAVVMFRYMMIAEGSDYLSKLTSKIADTDTLAGGLNVVLKSQSHVPLLMQSLLSCVRRAFERMEMQLGNAEHDDSALTVWLGAFFFLRFICPALTKPNPNKRKNSQTFPHFLRVAKHLQRLSNHNPKEPRLEKALLAISMQYVGSLPAPQGESCITDEESVQIASELCAVTAEVLDYAPDSISVSRTMTPEEIEIRKQKFRFLA